MLLRRLRSRLRAVWNWKRRESELDEEIAFHLSEEAEEHATDGLSPAEARAAARKDLGNELRVREDTRESWGLGPIERLFQDVRFGARLLRRHPSVSVVAVLTLALGIGATAAVFSVVNPLMLRPLPFPDADRLVMLFATSPSRGVFRDTTSFLDFTAWKTESQAFAYAAAFRQEIFNVTGDGAPEPVEGLRATDELLNALDAPPEMGRMFNATEQHEQRPLVLISHRLWAQRYGRDPQILNRTILINEVSHAVVGVLRPGLQFPGFTNVELIVPLPERSCRSCGYLRGVARLKADVPLSTAQRQLDVIAAAREQAFPDSNKDRGVNVVPLHDVAVGSVRTPLYVLLGAGLLVLLIGCANVGHLVLARGIARQRELAVRTALGAGRARLVRQLLTESLTLAVAAAVIGSLLAIWGSRFLVSSLAQQFRLPALPVEWTLLVWAVLLALIAGTLSGLPPALMAWRTGTANVALRQDNRTQSAGIVERRLGRVLLVGQVALTMTLLIGAGLLLKSFVRLQGIDLGADTHRLLTADLLLPKRYAEIDQRNLYIDRLLEAIGALPGVEAAALHIDPPFFGGGQRETFHVDGVPDPAVDHGHPAAFNIVSGDFFRAMDMPVIRGRAFTSEDTAGSMPVAIVNETMARQFWAQDQALGKRLQFYYEKDRSRWLTVVGVARDMRYHGRLTEPVPQVFVTSRQPFYTAMDPYTSLAIRTADDPGKLLASLPAAIWTIDKDQPVSNVKTMDRVLWESAAAPRVYTLLLGAFAVIALLIASAGIYATSAYAVAQRTHEMGIRLALGATPRQASMLVLGQHMILAAIGVGLGIAGALALTDVVAGFLFGIAPTDIATFGWVLALFISVALFSTLIPARRVAAIDPTRAFRSE